jgi:hypothetical protein
MRLAMVLRVDQQGRFLCIHHFDADEVAITHQLQGVGRQLLYRETKTEASEAVLPLPDLCVTALRERRAGQFTDAEPSV